MSGERARPECLAAREAIHASLDRDLVDAALRQRLEAHLERCPACRELQADLGTIRRGLGSLPELRLPDAAFERVLDRTVRRDGRRRRPWRWAAAAAAAIVMLAGGLWLRNGDSPADPSAAELERAAREARLVLRLASRAIQRTERAAVDQVLSGEVSGALRRVPIDWPEREPDRGRKP